MLTKLTEILSFKGSHVHSVGQEVTVAEAVEVMNREKVGALLILSNRNPVGIFTERDILVRVVAGRRDPLTTYVYEVMTDKLVVVKPTITIEEAIRVVTEKRCRHLPVIDDGRLLGLISSGDLMRWLVRDHENEIDLLLEYIYGRQPKDMANIGED